MPEITVFECQGCSKTYAVKPAKCEACGGNRFGEVLRTRKVVAELATNQLRRAVDTDDEVTAFALVNEFGKLLSSAPGPRIFLRKREP